MGCVFAVVFVFTLAIWLAMLYCYLAGMVFNDLLIKIPYAVSVPVMYYRAKRFDNQQKYDKLDCRYNMESNSRLKGFLVIVAIILNYVMLALMSKLWLCNG